MAGELVLSQFRWTTTANQDFVIGDPSDVSHSTRYLVFQTNNTPGYSNNPHLACSYNSGTSSWALSVSVDGVTNIGLSDVAHQTSASNIFSVTNTFNGLSTFNTTTIPTFTVPQISIAATGSYTPSSPNAPNTITFVDPHAGTDDKIWQFFSPVTTGTFGLYAVNDAYTGANAAITLTRTGTTISGVTINSALTATSFTGAGTGLTGTATSLSIGGNAATATSATTATNVSAANNTTNASYFPVFATAQGTSVPLGTDSTFTFNPSTGVLAATSFIGAGTGLTGTAASLSIGGNAATATTAINVSAANNTTNATYYPVFSTTQGTSVALGTDSTFTFNPSTGILTATSFTGAGTGLTGTAASLSIGGNAATATSATTATNVSGGSISATTGTFTGNLFSSSITNPAITTSQIGVGGFNSISALYFINSAQSLDNKVWIIDTFAGSFNIGTGNDALSNGSTAFSISRSGITPLTCNIATQYLIVSGSTSINSSTASVSTTSGALTVMGGIGFGGDLHSGGSGIFSGNLTATSFIGSGASLTNLPIGNHSITTGYTGTVFNVTGGTAQMAGLAAAVTPSKSGIILCIITFSSYVTTPASGAAVFEGYYGTGTAPAAYAAVTGTSFTSNVTWSDNANYTPTTIVGVISGLALGTPIWIDVAGFSGSTLYAAQFTVALTEL